MPAGEVGRVTDRVGLVVDDDESVGASVHEVDVALERDPSTGTATYISRQCGAVAVRVVPRECGAHERGDGRFLTRARPRPRPAPRGVVDAGAGREVDGLQHRGTARPIAP